MLEDHDELVYRSIGYFRKNILPRLKGLQFEIEPDEEYDDLMPYVLDLDTDERLSEEEIESLIGPRFGLYVSKENFDVGELSFYDRMLKVEFPVDYFTGAY